MLGPTLHAVGLVSRAKRGPGRGDGAGHRPQEEGRELSGRAKTMVENAMSATG